MRDRDSLGASKLVAASRVDGRSERLEPGSFIAEATGHATDVRRMIAYVDNNNNNNHVSVRGKQVF